MAMTLTEAQRVLEAVQNADTVVETDRPEGHKPGKVYYLTAGGERITEMQYLDALTVINRSRNKVWVIFSSEHKAFQQREHRRYTTNLCEAEFYSEDEVTAIVQYANRCRPGNDPAEIAIPVNRSLLRHN